EVEEFAGRLLETSRKVAVKLLSKTVTHKSDVGGVVLSLETPAQAREAAEGIERRLREHVPDGIIDGFSVQPMIERKTAQELILGLSHDVMFGPVVLFG